MSWLDNMSNGAAGVAGGAISAVGNVISSGINALSQQSTNRANARLAQQQNEWNRQMWADTNAYNAPSAVVARLRQAGLNPAMMYGDGSSGVSGASPMQSADLANQNPYHVDNPLMGIGDTLLATKNLQVQAKWLDKQGQEADQRIKESIANSEFIKANTKAVATKMALDEANTALLKQNTENAQFQFKLLQQDFEANNISMDEARQRLAEARESWTERMKSVLLDNKYKSMMINKTSKEIEEIVQTTQNLARDYILKGKEIDLREVMNALDIEKADNEATSSSFWTDWLAALVPHIKGGNASKHNRVQKLGVTSITPANPGPSTNGAGSW